MQLTCNKLRKILKNAFKSSIVLHAEYPTARKLNEFFLSQLYSTFERVWDACEKDEDMGNMGNIEGWMRDSNGMQIVTYHTRGVRNCIIPSKQHPYSTNSFTVLFVAFV